MAVETLECPLCTGILVLVTGRDPYTDDHWQCMQCDSTFNVGDESTKKPRPKPVLSIESRPSQFTGISLWLVLEYRDFHEERMLPRDFMALYPDDQDKAVAPLAEEMRKKLAPILEAEDRLVIPI